MKIIHKYQIFICLIIFLFGIEKAYSQPKLEITILKQGTGTEAVRHSQISVHYTGWLSDGTKFDSSLDRKKPLQFILGNGEVIPGWDVGLEGMKVGGTRILLIPPKLAYGKKGAGKIIPSNATLKFEVSLLKVIPPKYTNVSNAGLETLIKKGVKVFDIRRKEEWIETGIIDDSIKLTAFNKRGAIMPNFFEDLSNMISKDEEIALICRTGNRTSVLANYLSTRLGYSNIYNVKNGIKMWLKESLPVIK